MSLRTRLLAGMAFVAAMLVIVAFVITTETRAQLIDQIDDRLIAGASDNRGDEFRSDRRDGDRHSEPTAGTSPERQSDFYEGAIGADGELVTFFVPNIGGEGFAPPEIDAEFLSTLDDEAIFTASATEGGIDYRVRAVRDRGGDSVFITALPLNDVESTVSRLTWVALIGIASILAVLGLVTWWMIRLGITPIKRMTTTAGEIADGDLSARVEESSTAAESHDLAVALNTMLGTIQGALHDQAESENRLRRFVSDASHELRTPVTTIRGYAELYRLGGLTEPGALDDAMRRTEAESLRMSRLVEDMLLLAKLDEQRPLDRRPVDLAQLAIDAGADARVVAPDRSIVVDAGSPTVVSGDDDRLRQVFANLVGNAIAHTDHESTITIRAFGNESTATLEVEDTGTGMPPEVVERVTERFYRADPSRSRQQGGSGLGLAIVEATASAHGGTLRIASSPGQGTIVTFEIPR
jgi:two-component system OmpR family sensor kinase